MSTNYERFNRNNWMSNSKMHYYRCCWQSYGHLFPKMSLYGYFISYFCTKFYFRQNNYSFSLCRRFVSAQFASLLLSLEIRAVSQALSPESISRFPLALSSNESTTHHYKLIHHLSIAEISSLRLTELLEINQARLTGQLVSS